MLLTEEEIGRVVIPLSILATNSIYQWDKAMCLAQARKLVEWLDEKNSLVRHESPNHPDQCGLLLTLECWQELRKEVGL